MYPDFEFRKYCQRPTSTAEKCWNNLCSSMTHPEGSQGCCIPACCPRSDGRHRLFKHCASPPGKCYVQMHGIVCHCHDCIWLWCIRIYLSHGRTCYDPALKEVEMHASWQHVFKENSLATELHNRRPYSMALIARAGQVLHNLTISNSLNEVNGSPCHS